MKKTFSEEEIISSIQKEEVSPSEAWQKKTLAELRMLSSERSVSASEKMCARFKIWLTPFSKSLFFNLNKMRKIFSIAVVIALIILAGRYYFSPSAQAYRHLNNANAAIEQLKLFVQGESFAMVNIAEPILSAYAQDEGVVVEETAEPVVEETVVTEDAGTVEETTPPTEEPPVEESAPVAEETTVTPEQEQTVEQLVETVVEETEAAIESTEEVASAEDAAELLDAVDETQDETVEVLSDVVETVETETVVETVTEAIEQTVEENAAVEAAQETVAEAAATGTEVEVDIPTSEDEGQTETVKEQTTEKIQKAQELMDGLKLEGMELTPAMQEKYDTIQKLLEECTAGEKCQAGKAKGLATALSAKVRNEIRQEERVKGDDVEEETTEAVETDETDSADEEELAGDDETATEPTDEADTEENTKVKNTPKGPKATTDDTEEEVEDIENETDEVAAQEEDNGPGNSNKKLED